MLGRSLTALGVTRPGLLAPDAPLVFHAQFRNRGEGTPTPISAIVLGAERVQLQYRAHDAADWTTVDMTPTRHAGTYRYVIPPEHVTADGVEYQIIATGRGGVATDGPHAIGVQRL